MQLPNALFRSTFHFEIYLTRSATGSFITRSFSDGQSGVHGARGDHDELAGANARPARRVPERERGTGWRRPAGLRQRGHARRPPGRKGAQGQGGAARRTLPHRGRGQGQAGGLYF